MSVMEPDLQDPALVAEVDLARAAAQEEAGDEWVGAHVGPHVEGEAAVTHLFEADKPGYRGWRWAVTLTSAGPDTEVTVSEVVLLPGPDALVAPDWVPWEHRVKAGDLGVGDLLPTAPDDPRLVPAYAASDDPAVEEVATEVGLGRVRVMARPARLDAATRWQHSEFGPRSDMARSAPAQCGTCGFYLPLAGSLRAVFGTCGNEISPADGHVVHAEYGCGAHSEAEVEQVSPVLVANLIYDDARLDLEPLVTEPTEAPAAEQQPAAEEKAAVEEQAVADEQAAAEDQPVIEDQPAAEEKAIAEEVEQPVSTTGFVAAADGEVTVVAAEQAPAPVERDDVAGPAEEPVATDAPGADGDVAPDTTDEAPAPLEPVTTAETSIDAPVEAGAPATLTPWIRPEGAAKQDILEPRDQPASHPAWGPDRTEPVDQEEPDPAATEPAGPAEPPRQAEAGLPAPAAQTWAEPPGPEHTEPTPASTPEPAAAQAEPVGTETAQDGAAEPGAAGAGPADG